MSACCEQGRRLANNVEFAEAELRAAARKASFTAAKHGQPRPDQLADIAGCRARKATNVDALDDHVEYCGGGR